MANFIYMVFLVKISFLITITGDLGFKFFFLTAGLSVAALSTAMLFARKKYTLLKECQVSKVMYQHATQQSGEPLISVFESFVERPGQRSVPGYMETEIIVSTHGCSNGKVVGIYEGCVSVDELVRQLIAINVLKPTQEVKVHCCYPSQVSSTITNLHIKMLFPTVKTVTYASSEGISGFGKMFFLKKVRMYV